MPKDFDSLDDFENYTSDMSDLVSAGSKHLNFKMALFIFIIYIILHSDIFLTRVLQRVPNTVDGYPPRVSNRGHIIIGIIISLFFLTTDLLIKNNIV